MADLASNYEAFRWTSQEGMVSLRNLLIKQGIDNLKDWTLTSASDVSADGRTIVGYGYNPDGKEEAWITTLATIPEPSTITLAAAGRQIAPYKPAGLVNRTSAIPVLKGPLIRAMVCALAPSSALKIIVGLPKVMTTLLRRCAAKTSAARTCSREAGTEYLDHGFRGSHG